MRGGTRRETGRGKRLHAGRGRKGRVVARGDKKKGTELWRMQQKAAASWQRRGPRLLLGPQVHDPHLRELPPEPLAELCAARRRLEVASNDECGRVAVLAGVEGEGLEAERHVDRRRAHAHPAVVRTGSHPFLGKCETHCPAPSPPRFSRRVGSSNYYSRSHLLRRIVAERRFGQPVSQPSRGKVEEK